MNIYLKFATVLGLAFGCAAPALAANNLTSAGVTVHYITGYNQHDGIIGNGIVPDTFNFQGLLSVDVLSNSIILTDTSSGIQFGNSPGNFDGFIFDFTGGPAITGASISSSSGVSSPAGNVPTFTADSVSLNVSNVSFADVGSTETIGLSFAPSAVPEPTIWAMMLVGMGLVGGVLRRKSAFASADLRLAL